MLGARALLGSLLAAITLAACGGAASPSTPAKPPTATEILNKPDKANVKDAHFTLAAHLVSSNVTVDATGDGLMVLQPQRASHFKMHATVAGQSLNFEQITVGDKEYDLAPDNPRWTVKASTSTGGGLGSFNGTAATYVGEESLKLGKAWHVKAKDSDGNPFDAWVREKDGYPLKYSGTQQGSVFTLDFDQFNTGQTITAPPASDVQSG